MKRKKLFLAIASICIVLTLLLLTFVYTSSSLVVTRYKVVLGSRGISIRIVQLSDLHLRSFGDFEKSIVEKVAELKPDIVVLTGDYIEDPRSAKYLERFMSFLRDRLGSIPIYAVIGNWELQGATEGIVREIFDRYGIELLINEYRVVELKDTKIIIVGLDDYLWGSPNLSIVKELPGADLYIALAHEPSLALALAEQGFKGIVFAGHCHGGQIKIFGKPMYLPRGCLPDLYEGMRILNATTIIISRGLGTAIAPLRIGVNPEIVVVDIRL